MSPTGALARYAKQLQLAAPDAMRQKRYLDNVTEMAIATNGHLRPVYASGPMARSRRCALKARRTTWLRLSNLSAQKRFGAGQPHGDFRRRTGAGFSGSVRGSS
jgi:hypothetical protein